MNAVLNAALDGARAKIGRAKHHFLQMEAAINLLRPEEGSKKVPPYEYDAERQQLIINSAEPKPLDPSFPLMVGDCIHNLRSALDHLVFQLAVLNGKGTEAESKTAFPIYLTPTSFNDFTRNKVRPFIASAALAEIEKFQPYAADGAGEEDVLWVLSQLDNIDKHRLLVVISPKFRPTYFRVQVPTGEVLETEIPDDGDWKPLKNGAEVIRFDLSKAIKQPGKVHVNVQTAHAIHIVDTGLFCDNMDLGLVLSDCRTLAEGILDHFGKMFFGET